MFRRHTQRRACVWIGGQRRIDKELRPMPSRRVFFCVRLGNQKWDVIGEQGSKNETPFGIPRGNVDQERWWSSPIRQQEAIPRLAGASHGTKVGSGFIVFGWRRRLVNSGSSECPYDS